MKKVKVIELQLEEEKKKIEELAEERKVQEMVKEQWDENQDEEEYYEEDAWTQWHQAEEYTEQAQDSFSKDSSFVVVSAGKDDSSKE